MILRSNDVLRLDDEMGNAVAMQKCDTLYQLATEIHNLVAPGANPSGVMWWPIEW